MSGSIKSSTYLEMHSRSLNAVKETLELHNKVLERNTKELKKLNVQADELKIKEKKMLKTALTKLETEIQWVKSEEPAINTDTEHLLKKLNIF